MTAVPAQSDASVKQGSPSQNLAGSARLVIRGTGSSLSEFAFLSFKAPFPLGATILQATLHLFRAGAWSGSRTVEVRRVTERWGESTITYTNRPATVTTNLVSVAAGAGADNSEITFDVTLLMRDVAAGSAYYGLRVGLTQDAEVALRSSEAGDPAVQPYLEVTWSEVPDPPDRLTPSDGQATQATKPLLTWQVNEQTSYQVQIDDTTDFATPVFDTGKVSGTDQQLDLSTTAFAGVSTGATRYWRVRAWNLADVASEWSDFEAGPAQFTRQPLGSLTISSPTSTAPETTPPITWSFGGTQSRYRVALYRLETSGARTLLWEVMASDALVARTPPAGLIVTGRTYQAQVEVWDATTRAYDEHALATQTFTYVRSGAPAAPTGLTAAAYAPTPEAPSPAVVLEWHRSSAPDYWCLKVDGVEVADRITPATTFVSGDLYRLHWWGLSPRVAHTIEVEAVVQSGGAGTPLLHSTSAGPVTFTTQPIGVWLVDDTTAGSVPGDAVQLLSTEGASIGLGEAATTYTPIGQQAPVRIIDQQRGYEGSVQGSLHSDADRDTLLELKGRRQPVRLILQQLNVPVYLEEVSTNPTPRPGDPFYEAAVAFFQVGPPWPVP